MTRYLKRIYATIIVMLMAATTQVNGFEYNQSACEPECCDNQYCGVTLKAELLYWRPELCGLEGAFGNTTIATSVNSSAITTTTVTESDKEPHSKWNAGFRIGADVALNCFDAELDWTHFNGRANFHDDEQHGHWKIHYDVIDLTFGRYFDAWSSCFRLRPFIGVRGAYIHQRLDSHLETLFTSTLIGNNTVFTDKDDRESFWGIGPQIGLDALWNIGCNFSLYGKFALVTYYGHVKSRNYDVDTFTSTVSVCNGKRRHCFNNFGTDAEIGVRWDTCLPSCFCCCDLDVMLKLGLEQHRIYEFSELGSDGNLSLDGVVLGIGVGSNF